MKTEKKGGYSFENKKGDKKQYIPLNISKASPLLLKSENYRAELYPTDLDLYENKSTYKEVRIEEEKKMPSKAIYDAKDGESSLEYISTYNGVKENFILNKKPIKNTIDFELKMKGVYQRENSIDEGITFYDNKTDDIVAFIAAPFIIKMMLYCILWIVITMKRVSICMELQVILLLQREKKH